MSPDIWGRVSRLAVGALLFAPERVVDVDPRDIAGGPCREIVLELRRRSEAGRPIDSKALLTPGDDDLQPMGGRSFLLDLLQEAPLAGDLPRYLREARGLAVLDRLGRIAAGGSPADPDELRRLADHVVDQPGDVDLGFIDAAAYGADGDQEEVEWVWQGFLAPGSVTLFTGPPKRGKSTLIAGLVAAICGSASEFLGQSVGAGPVIFVSEEAPRSLKPKVTGVRGLYVLDRLAAFPRRPWPVIVARIASEARRVGATLVVIDTLAFWSGLGPDQEKDAGAAQAALEPLLGLASTGPAVLVTHHDRKGGGEDGEAVRGSSAFGATVDCLVGMPRRATNEAASSRRRLQSVSRWGDETPEVLVFDRRADGSLGVVTRTEPEAPSGKDLRTRILSTFTDTPAAVGDIAAALEVTRQRIEPDLKALVDEGAVEVVRESRGKSPALYRLVATLQQPPLATSVGSDSLLLPPTLREGGNNNGTLDAATPGVAATVDETPPDHPESEVESDRGADLIRRLADGDPGLVERLARRPKIPAPPEGTDAAPEVLIGRRCIECLELLATDGQDTCSACALDLRDREIFWRGYRQGWAQCLQELGLTGPTRED